MNRSDFLKSIPGLAALPILASEVVDLDKPKLIILSFNDYLADNQHELIHESMKEHLPNWKVLILDGGAKFEVRDL